MEDRQELKAIFQDTIDYCVSPMTPEFTIPKLLSYNSETLRQLCKEIKPRYKSMQVIVENSDSFALAKHFLDSNETTEDKIMVLNMASSVHAGGGVANGASAQEECLFRMSNYFLHLPQMIYKLRNDEFILSRNVRVIKDEDYKLLPETEQFHVNCLACAAITKPKTKQVERTVVYAKEMDHKVMYNKIFNIFLCAYLHGYDTLVLGALGCGAFANPPEQVARMFLEVIKKFNNCFKTVSFAVLSYDDNENYNIFKVNVETAYKSSK